MENLIEACENVCKITDSKVSDFTPKEIQARTLIVEQSGFNIQAYEKEVCGSYRGRDSIYYIQKIKRIFTEDQMFDYVNEHKDEKFILLDNHEADLTTIWFLPVSEPNELTLYCFNTTNSGHMELFAIIRNIPGESAWDKPVIMSDTCIKITPAEDGYYANEPTRLFFSFPSNSSYRREQYDGRLIGKSYSSANTKEILRDFLQIEGRTRIVKDESYRTFFDFKIGCAPEKERFSIIERYGLQLDQRECYYKHGEKYMYDESDCLDLQLPKEEWERITHRLSAKLEAMSEAKNSPYFNSAAIVVIGDPIKGHQRPTFHFVKAFRANKITEIVELARGELLIKDMEPTEIYCLTRYGSYIHVAFDIKGEIRKMFKEKETEIDPVTYNKWAEQKSFHPELLKLLSENYFDTIDPELVKLFNRLPFGALLIDQLITAGYSTLAVELGRYITERAYDPNFFCGRLEDLFPQCKGEETSLYKILNVSRNTAKYLLDDKIVGGNISRFIAKYKAIHYYGGSQILTDEIKLKVETYLTLFDEELDTMTLAFKERKFDFLEYPKLAKQVVKMKRKINDLAIPASNKWTIIRQYDEIVRAYASFIDYQKIAPEAEKEQWDPATQRIFLEFSLTGTPENPLDPMTEIDLREKHANNALKIYQDKANEEVVKQAEEKYAYRKQHAINKLRSMAALAGSKSFKNYVVLVPTQIYGVTVEGSVEKEGADQGHCLFRQYATQIIEGKFTPLWLRRAKEPGKSLVTFSLTADGRIDQTRGEGDRDITVEEAKAIAAWALTKVGYVTFKSEGEDIAPGGWPKNVSVPSLPKPSKDWLKRLSQTYELKA